MGREATKAPPPPFRLELLQGTLDMLILGSLRLKPLHGQAIVRAIEQRSGETLNVDHGSLYPALQRLQQEGWIIAEWGMSSSNRKAKFYSLTAAGRKQLMAESSRWERLSQAIAQVMNPVPEG
ncbi:MAG TPA: PadR family transcriptional regulator [Alloacidobacterium sp.]|nr:PadR family transcriptional regulator [Alloacidobacterium sp.]